MKGTFVTPRARIAAACVVAALAALVYAAPATAKHVGPPASAPTTSTWITDGYVLDIADGPGDTTFIGGNFNRVGPYTGAAALIDPATGALHDFPQADGRVFAAASDGDGGYYLGGDFTSIDRVRTPHIAHILADGSLDTDFVAPIYNGPVRALCLTDEGLYVGGGFEQIGDVTTGSLALLDPVDGDLRDLDAQCVGSVYALALNGSRLYVGGAFTSIGGMERGGLACLDRVTGEFDRTAVPTVEGSWATVFTICVLDGEVVVGGDFSGLDEESRACLGAFDATDGDLSDWQPQANNTVRALAHAGDALYVGGDFSAVAADPGHAYLAAFDDDLASSTPRDWSPTPDRPVAALLALGDRLFVGGQFTTFGAEPWVPRLRAAAFDLTGAEPTLTEWEPAPMADVEAIHLVDGASLLSGDFGSGWSMARAHLAQLDADGVPTDFTPEMPVRSGFESIVYDGQSVYAAGWFEDEVHGVVARFDSLTGERVDMLTGGEPSLTFLHAIELAENGDLYVGGDYGFYLLDKAPLAIADAMPVGGRVYSIRASEESVYVGGDFWHFDNVERQAVVRLAASDLSLDDWDPRLRYDGEGSAVVHDILIRDGSAYVGGAFTMVEATTTAVSNLAKISTTGAVVDPLFAPVVDDTVRGLAWNGPNLVAVGDFNTVDWNDTYGVAEIDRYGQFVPRPSYPGPYKAPVTAMVKDGELIVGGWFNGCVISAEGFIREARNSLASWDWPAPATPPIISDFTASPGAAGDEIDLTWSGPMPAAYVRTRIYRSSYGPAVKPDGGPGQTVVYEGPGTEFTDTGRLPGVLYVYTAFPQDSDGTWGDRAVAWFAIGESGGLAQSVLTCSAGQTTVAFNGSVSVIGTLTAGGAPKPGAPMELWGLSVGGSGWSKIADGVDEGGGRYSARMRIRSNTYFEWRFDGDATSTPGVSPMVTYVRAHASLGTPRVSPASPKAGRSFHITGAVGPAHPAASTVRVTIYRRIGSRWVPHRQKDVRVGPRSTSYSVWMRVPSAGRYRVVTETGDASHAWTASPSRFFRVR